MSGNSNRRLGPSFGIFGTGSGGDWLTATDVANRNDPKTATLHRDCQARPTDTHMCLCQIGRAGEERTTFGAGTLYSPEGWVETEIRAVPRIRIRCRHRRAPR